MDRPSLLRALSSSLVLLLVACSQAPAAESDTAATTEPQAVSTSSSSDATTGASDDSTTDDSSTGGAEHPCAVCGPDEFCQWVGADDACVGYPEVQCVPLPPGCDRHTICSLDCVHQICGGYQCGYADPCEFGDAVLCAQNNRCDPWDPDACRTEGTTCLPVSCDDDPFADRWSCVPVPAPGVPVGEPCTVTSDGSWSWGDCAPGAVCSRVDADTAQGICTARCTGSPDAPECADPATHCQVWGDDEIEIHLCEPTCDPLAGPAACPMGQVCVGLDPVCVPDISGDGGAYTEVCSAANDCDPGHLCVSTEYVPTCNPADPSCCTPYCDLSQPACPPELMCLSPYADGEAPPDLENFGHCLVPL